MRRCAGDFFLGFFFGAQIRPAIEPRLDAAGRGGLAARRRRRASAATEQKRKAGAEAPDGMDQAAERNPGGIPVFFLGFRLVIFVVFFFLCLIVGGAAPDESRSAGEGEERGQSENDGEHKPVKSKKRRAKHHGWRPQYGVADDATEPRWQRPMHTAGEARSKSRGEQSAEDPKHHAQPFAAKRAMTKQAIAPNADRKEQRQRA